MPGSLIEICQFLPSRPPLGNNAADFTDPIYILLHDYVVLKELEFFVSSSHSGKWQLKRTHNVTRYSMATFFSLIFQITHQNPCTHKVYTLIICRIFNSNSATNEPHLLWTLNSVITLFKLHSRPKFQNESS